MSKMNFSGKENNISSFGAGWGGNGFSKGEFETNSLKINVLTENIPFLFLSLKKKRRKNKMIAGVEMSLCHVCFYSIPEKKKKKEYDTLKQNRGKKIVTLNLFQTSVGKLTAF